MEKKHGGIGNDNCMISNNWKRNTEVLGMIIVRFQITGKGIRYLLVAQTKTAKYFMDNLWLGWLCF